MRVTGSAALHASAAQAWAALTDPAVLQTAIPGCETLVPLPPHAAHLTVTAAVASTDGLYSGPVEVTDSAPPESLAIKAALAGGPGKITASIRLRLTETADADHVTQVSYEADADVDGDLAAIGQSLLTAAATRLATRFFEALDHALTPQPRTVPDLAEASHIPDAGVSVAAAEDAKASASGQRTPHWYERLPAGGRAYGRRSAPAGGRDMDASAPRGRNFVLGAIVGTVVGVTGTKLGTLIARRNR